MYVLTGKNDTNFSNDPFFYRQIRLTQPEKLQKMLRKAEF